jgi:hypothetical protein
MNSEIEIKRQYFYHYLKTAVCSTLPLNFPLRHNKLETEQMPHLRMKGGSIT